MVGGGGGLQQITIADFFESLKKLGDSIIRVAVCIVWGLLVSMPLYCMLRAGG